VSPWPGQSNATVLAAGRLARFVSGNASRHLFVDRMRIADVALLMSLPTLFWRRFSSLAVGNAFAPTGIQYYEYFSGVARILEDEHVSYDTPILGHPDLGSLDVYSCEPTDPNTPPPV